ncbi:Flp pilus assembly protein CpaB [Pseudomethylobacillus aquaticus]|uniref:Flp pilus assembly protein CpaB n=1 Tax=Pseudomethylobacillus aquaticus TaxID=2676064 RepID=A0A3N0UYQ2_9PROT|nr:Flp pilus assembly protein CpaB [Pseudomethylobacillus aquaticus]ROH85565.1 Flp pilus assembly protein CpaB [Pseudomethylobacillus aquaticus]
MKDTRALLFLLFAIVAGLAAVYLASRWLTERASDVNQIAVAAQDINLGQRVTVEMVRMVEWPISSRPDGAVSDIKMLEGRVLKTSLLRGEPVLEAKLAPQGTQGGLSAVIAEGKRAITVRVNDVIGVAGFALPGNFVDIIVNTQTDENGNPGKDISKIVLERILVLAIAQEVGRDETKPRVVNAVTLEVTPQQAERLDLARSVGTLSLVLRNQVDPDQADTGGITKLTLLQDKHPAPAALPPAVVVSKPAVRVAKPKPVTPAVVEPPASPRCVTVVTGMRSSRECF